MQRRVGMAIIILCSPVSETRMNIYTNDDHFSYKKHQINYARVIGV